MTGTPARPYGLADMLEPQAAGAGACARSLSLHRIVTGPEAGPPVLVLHGITGSRRYWLPRILRLGQRYRLLIPDLPGFGDSPKPPVDYTPGFFAEALAGLLDQEGYARTPVRVVGHSLGALLALELAARDPDRIQQLALLSVPRFSDPEDAHRVWFAGSLSYRNLLMANSLARNLAQVRRTGFRLTARYIRRLPWAVVADSRRFTYRSLTSTLEHCLFHHRLDDCLERLRPVPILLIHGQADQVAPVERMRELPSRYPFVSLHVIPRAGHHPFHTHGEACLRLIEAHLRREARAYGNGLGVQEAASQSGSEP